MLQPGEVRTPAARPTPLIGDWTRGDSTVWDSRDETSSQGTGYTPLNGFGQREDLWQISSSEQLAQQHLRSGDDDDTDVDAVRHTISQALAASQEATSHHSSHRGGFSTMTHPSTSYTAQSQSYTSAGHDDASSAAPYATFAVSSGNKFTVQHATDPRSTRGDHLLSREVSAQEIGSLGSRQSSTDSSALLAKFRSQSEILSDELYFQAKTFPPPPPSNSPIETRRVRAELWYLISRKWDITQQMPPPPRSPLPGMEEEHRLRLQELTRVPYRGDRWLAQSDHWFDWVQKHFDYPLENVATVLPPSFVMQMIA